MTDLTRPIIGIENRTAQEVFDIMCDRMKHSTPPVADDVSESGEFVLVPREPTEAMIDAARHFLEPATERIGRAAWNAYLYASPSPQHIGDAGGVEEVIKAAEAYNEEHGDPADTLHHGHGMIDAMRKAAALPPARVEAAPRVKALKWAEGDVQSSATSPFGAWYFVHQNGDEWFIHYGATEGYSSRDEAKAAAQADYEARIRSSLE